MRKEYIRYSRRRHGFLRRLEIELDRITLNKIFENEVTIVQYLSTLQF